jgi:glycosyltransferase involved in cell wall biosynthesis
VPLVSVVTPVFDQAAHLPRAKASLHAQTWPDWEHVVVDDGSTVPVPGATVRFEENRGLGAALNAGLDAARGDVIAYLPADDVLFRDHLATLVELLEGGEARLAGTACEPAGERLQLVQVAHRRTAERWLERGELESDDLGRLFLGRLGTPARSPAVTCGWTPHPRQRHRVFLAAHDGGLNTFRRRYRARGPLHFAPSDGAEVDEAARYARFRDSPAPRDGLRVLLAGELAYNPERILVLEARGCDLLGRWIDDPLGFMTVGPLPFGHVRDVEGDAWRAERPDVIYALLNWRAVPLAHSLLGRGVPLVFHFKEAPQRSLERGEWPLLADLVGRADAVVLSSAEERDWFEAALPGRLDPARTAVLDGDLPKREWLDAPRSPRTGGTVLLGRPYGFDAALLEGLSARGIAVHRPRVAPEDWVSALSRYDAGWLHPVPAANGGDLHAVRWDDLNLPARLPTLLAAGLPLVVPRGDGLHAARRVAEETGAGVVYDDLDDLAAQLADAEGMARRREAAWAAREAFTFDAHADRLLALLERVAGGG